MKKISFLVLLFSLVGSSLLFSSTIENELLMEIREQLPLAFEDENECERLYQKAIAVENPDPVLQGYIGAVYLAKSRHISIFQKLSFFNKGTDTLEAALKRSPEELELRFLRLTIQLNLPSFLGYSKNISSDKQFVLKNCRNAPPLLRERITNFVVDSGHFNQSEVTSVR